MSLTEIEYQGKTIEIVYDHEPESPRDWSNIGTMICFHRRYNLGDEHEYTHEQYNSWEDMEQDLSRGHIIVPLYLYDHSGLAISTSSFSCAWDSGQVGFIRVSKEDARQEYGWKNITKQRRQHIEAVLSGEVEVYNQFLAGQVFGYELSDSKGEFLESCYGYYSSDQAMLDAISCIECAA